jgi:chemotaxis methyl-accepting protein methylase
MPAACRPSGRIDLVENPRRRRRSGGFCWCHPLGRERAASPNRSVGAMLTTTDRIDVTDDGLVLAILAHAQAGTGIDFRLYRRSTIERRLQNRMLAVGLSCLAQYTQLLQESDDELARLIERLTIKVSRFYRNRHTFDLLARSVLPAIANHCGHRPLRVWSAGCGRGEEAYTLAILLEEAGIDGSILATDVDSLALHAAELGRYPAAALVELPALLAARHFERCVDDPGGVFRVTEPLRHRVSFRRHDLTSGVLPPGSFDLVACRNVLIYMKRETQEEVLSRLRAATADDGIMVLGEAEWPSPGRMLTMKTIDARARIFRALPAEPAR